MKKFKSKAGFTLAELLIVLAILSILIAIAIPVFSTQLERARVTVDATNARAACSLAYSEYMLNHASAGAVTYTFGTDENDNLFVLSHTDAEEKELEDNKPDADATEIKAKSGALQDVSLSVTIDDGKVTKNTWLSVLKK